MALIVITGPPGSPEAARAVADAAVAAADIVLTGEGVRLALSGALEGFCGTAFACKEDLEARSIPPGGLEKGVRVLRRKDLDSLVRGGG